jgi:hypothetical protein
MRCAAEQGDLGGALAVYRRCREMLSIIAGRQPSSETERLAVHLGIKS